MSMGVRMNISIETKTIMDDNKRITFNRDRGSCGGGRDAGGGSRGRVSTRERYS